MPQLELITYFNQIFWLVIFFSFFYCLVTFQLLPYVYKIQKVRYYKYNCMVSKAKIFDTESTKIKKIYFTNIFNFLGRGLILVSQLKKKSFFWLEFKKKNLLISSFLPKILEILILTNTKYNYQKQIFFN